MYFAHPFRPVGRFPRRRVDSREAIVAALVLSFSMVLLLWVFRLAFWSTPATLPAYTLILGEYPDPQDPSDAHPHPHPHPHAPPADL